MSGEGEPPPDTVTITAPVDVKEGDFLMIGAPGAARRDGWAMALSPADLERFALDAERNPIYLLSAIVMRFRQLGAHHAKTGEALPIEAIQFSAPELIALNELATRALTLAVSGDMTGAQKAAALAASLGFTRKGWNAFVHFERDARAHYAEHRRVQMQRDGASYEAARDAVAGQADPRTKERLFARGKKRGARPNGKPKPPP